MDCYGRYDTRIAYKDTKLEAGIPLNVSTSYIYRMHTEIEAILVEGEDDAVSTVRSSLLLWGFGLMVILGNLLFNPLWEGPWYAKLWLPAVYVGALVVMLVSKFNRRTEFGKIVFEHGWIRIAPKGGDREVFRVAELDELSIHPGKPGFFRNPLTHGSLGTLTFRHKGEARSFAFRLHRHEDVDVLVKLMGPSGD
jgi:hypothetical protein